MNGTWKNMARLMVLFLVFVVAFGAFPTYATADTDGTLKDLGDRFAELEQQQQAIQREIDKTKSEKDKQLAVKQQIDGQVSLTREQIAVLEEQIGALEQAILANEQLIGEKEVELEQQCDAFKLRMRASYMAGDATTLGLILGAESFSDFLTRAEYTSRVARRDRELMDKLNEDIRFIEEVKAQVEQNREELDAAKGLLAVKEGDLSAQLKVVESQIADIAALEQQYRANKAEIDRNMEQVQAEIAAIYASYQSTGTYDGGLMQWPVPSCTQITSDYGWRFSNTNWHTGIDISKVGVNGQSIVAGADGTVIKAQLTFTPGKGYGKYILIDHGGDISTLYGHCSEILVSEGQKVLRGQVIARVGNTGWSTGPHLHFEVRVGGEETNPWPYLR